MFDNGAEENILSGDGGSDVRLGKNCITTSMKWAGNVARMGAKMNAYKILVGKPEGKRSLRRRRCRWVDYIKMDLSYNEVVWTGLIWLRIGTSGGPCEPSGSIKC
jgi:hypothetical protein